MVKQGKHQQRARAAQVGYNCESEASAGSEDAASARTLSGLEGLDWQREYSKAEAGIYGGSHRALRELGSRQDVRAAYR